MHLKAIDAFLSVSCFIFLTTLLQEVFPYQIEETTFEAVVSSRPICEEFSLQKGACVIQISFVEFPEYKQLARTRAGIPRSLIERRDTLLVQVLLGEIRTKNQAVLIGNTIPYRFSK